jgi:DNA-binding NarL/FixJ family response regulator
MKPSAAKRPRVILADDHTMVAEALSQYLAECCELVCVVDNGRKLVEAAKRLRPEVIVSDISMPNLSGLEAMRRLKSDGVEAKFIFLTMYGDRQLAGEALRSGASAYLLKTSAGEELIRAVNEVLKGRVYITPLIARDALAAMSAPEQSPLEKLTLRQREVLRLIARGQSMKEIAAALDLSPRTVETHKYDMMHALGFETTAELMQFAWRNGLSPDDLEPHLV